MLSMLFTHVVRFMDSQYSPGEHRHLKGLLNDSRHMIPKLRSISEDCKGETEEDEFEG